MSSLDAAINSPPSSPAGSTGSGAAAAPLLPPQPARSWLEINVPSSFMRWTNYIVYSLLIVYLAVTFAFPRAIARLNGYSFSESKAFTKAAHELMLEKGLTGSYPPVVGDQYPPRTGGLPAEALRYLPPPDDYTRVYVFLTYPDRKFAFLSNGKLLTDSTLQVGDVWTPSPASAAE